MKNYTFKLSVFDGKKEVLQQEISYEAMMSIISSSADSESNHALFEMAASHNSETVREYVAGKDNLSKNTVDILSADKSINVLRSLVRSSAFRRNASEKTILDLTSKDNEIARTIADSYEQYEMADPAVLISTLLKCDEPAVVANLASNYSTPKKIVKELTGHSDPHVAGLASDRLKNW